MNKKTLIYGGIIFVILCLFIISLKSRKPKAVAETAPPGFKDLYAQAVQLRKNRDMIKAKETYQQILMNYPDAENIDSIQKELEELNMNVIFSNAPLPHRAVMHEVVTGDTLGKIAKEYGTTIALIKRNNNLNSDIIRLGQKLRVWTGSFNVLVDKSQNVLILKDENEVIKVYHVSTGEGNSTPVGDFKVVTKLIDPVWFNKGIVVPPESPQNVLGTRWLGFDLPGYGIHGTVDPNSIGEQVTAGCVRMLNEDVEELYSLLPLGTEVVVVD